MSESAGAVEEPVKVDWDQAVAQAKETLGDEQAFNADDKAVEVTPDDTETTPIEEPEAEKVAEQALDTETTETEEPLSNEDLETLRKSSPEMAKLVDNLTGWRANLTQQAQAQADERKRVDAYLPSIEAFETSSLEGKKQILRAVAADHGIELSAPAAAPEPEVDDETLFANELRDDLGEDYGVLADPFANPLTRQIDRRLDRRLKVIEEHQAAEKQKQSLADVAEAESKFVEKYPDYKEYEAAMMEEAKKSLCDSKGNVRPTVLTPFEILERLYKFVAFDSSADKKAVIKAHEFLDRQNKAAATSDTSGPGVSPKNVQKTRPKKASFAEAAAAAERGERWAEY